MRKLMIVPVLALGLLFTTNTTAQEERAVEKETAMLVENAEQERQKKNFARIETNQLPVAVRTAVTRSHEGATITEAHVSEDRSKYKIVVTVGNERKTLYSDADGNLKEKKKK